MLPTPKINISFSELYHKTNHMVPVLWGMFLITIPSTRTDTRCPIKSSHGEPVHNACFNWNIALTLFTGILVNGPYPTSVFRCPHCFMPIARSIRSDYYCCFCWAGPASFSQVESDILWNFELTTVEIFQGLKQSSCYGYCNHWWNWQVLIPWRCEIFYLCHQSRHFSIGAAIGPLLAGALAGGSHWSLVFYMLVISDGFSLLFLSR